MDTFRYFSSTHKKIAHLPFREYLTMGLADVYLSVQSGRLEVGSIISRLANACLGLVEWTADGQATAIATTSATRPRAGGMRAISAGGSSRTQAKEFCQCR